MPVNFFGEEVELPVHAAPKVREPKAIRKWAGNPLGLRQSEMTIEDKKLYRRESKRAQMRRETEQEERRNEEKAFQRAQERGPVDSSGYAQRDLEQYVPILTYKLETEISAEAGKLLSKVLKEVGKDPDVDRIDGETVHAVAALNQGFSKGYIDTTPAGLFVSCRFVDLTMVNAIEAVHSPRPGAIPRYDRPWNTSPSFLAAYKLALKQSMDLCEKYPKLTERKYVTKIRDEWTRICEQECTL